MEQAATVIEVVRAVQVEALRHRILREGLPIETARFDRDDDLSTRHVAMFPYDGLYSGAFYYNPLCCASFFKSKYHDRPAWQLRGMATATEYQGRGLGKALLAHAEELLKREAFSDLIWCNARESAVAFYEKNGWQRDSDVFEIPTAGPHRKMSKRLV